MKPGDKLTVITDLFETITFGEIVTIERILIIDGYPYGYKLMGKKVSFDSKYFLPMDCILSKEINKICK